MADPCGIRDCINCCRKNSMPSGYLVDIEYNTPIRNFGITNSIDGKISFVIKDTQVSTSKKP